MNSCFVTLPPSSVGKSARNPNGGQGKSIPHQQIGGSTSGLSGSAADGHLAHQQGRRLDAAPERDPARLRGGRLDRPAASTRGPRRSSSRAPARPARRPRISRPWHPPRSCPTPGSPRSAARPRPSRRGRRRPPSTARRRSRRPARRAGWTPTRTAGCGRTRARRCRSTPARALLRRVGVEQIGAQHAVLDQRRRPLGDALAVERRGREALRVQPVVDEPEGRRGDLLTLASRRTASGHAGPRRPTACRR